MARRPAPLLLALLGGFEDGRDVQDRLDSEIRRLAHGEWLRTGNPDEFHNWNEAEKQLGGRLIHTGTVQWLHRELGSRERQLADTSALVRELEAKLARCQVQLRDVEPAMENQAAILVQRNRHLAECDSYIQGLRATLERQEAEVCAEGAWEAKCQDLKSALEGNEAELARRSEQFEQQDARIREMEAWLEARRGDLERGFVQLAAQGQMLREHEERCQRALDASTLQASLPSRIQDLESELALSRSELATRERHFVEGLEEATGKLKAEVVERDRRLAEEASSQAKAQLLKPVKQTTEKESNEPSVLELKPWEGQGQAVYSKGTEDPSRLSREEELVVQREEALVREGRLAQQEAQTQALGSLLRARRVELDAKAYQLQVLQAQLTAQERRSLEQEQRAKKCEGHMQARGLEQEKAAAEAKAQSEEVVSLQAQLRSRDNELAEQLATERALVAHSARRRELEEQLVELGERRMLQQEEQAKALGSLLEARAAELEAKSGQLEAQSARLDFQDRLLAEERVQAHRLESTVGTLQAELQGQHERLEAQHQCLAKEGLRASLLEVAIGQLREELEVESQQCQEREARSHELETSLKAVSLQSASEVEQLCKAQQCASLEAIEAQRSATSSEEQLQACVEELMACEAHREQLVVAEAQQRASVQEQLQASTAKGAELEVALQAQRDLRQTESTALDTLLQANNRKAEEELRAQGDEIATMEARLQLQAAQHAEELAMERTSEGVCLGRLEERLAHLLDKLRRTSEEVAAVNESRFAKPRKAFARAFFTVRGVDYTLLHAEAQVLAGFRAALEQVLALEAGPQVAPEDVSLELWAGSVVVCASITPPPGVSASSIEAQLRSSPTLPGALARSVAQVDGIERVSTGSLSVIVHNVRPEARPAVGNMGTADGVTHRGNDGLARQVSNPDAEELRFVECFSIGTPRRLVSGEPDPLPEDGAVRKRVRELEGKQAPPDEQAAGSGEGHPGSAAASSAQQRPSRICFRSRAYSPRLMR